MNGIIENALGNALGEAFWGGVVVSSVFLWRHRATIVNWFRKTPRQNPTKQKGPKQKGPRSKAPQPNAPQPKVPPTIMVGVLWLLFVGAFLGFTGLFILLWGPQKQPPLGLVIGGTVLIG